MKTLFTLIKKCSRFNGFAALALLPGLAAAQPVTRMISDSNPNNVVNGIYNSTASGTTPYPVNRHNLLAFEVNSTIYSTGVNNALLTANGVTYQNTNFQGFNTANSTITGNTSGSSLYLLMGKNIDGNTNNPDATNANIVGQSVPSVLNDGSHGLDIGTGVTNLPVGVNIRYNVGCINPATISDAIPDILITQIADPSGTATGNYRFLDASLNLVGSIVTPNFSNVNAVGRNVNDFFTLQASTPVATAVVNGTASNTNAYRDIRMRGLSYSDFGITSANAGNIAYFVYTGDNNADIAFIAYNTNSMTVTANQNTWVGNTSNNWATGSNWFCGVVPTTSTNVSIPQVSTNNPQVGTGVTGSANNLSVAASGSVSVVSTGVLRVAGAITNSGTINVTDGRVDFVGSTAQTIPANVFSTNTIKNLYLSNASGVTLGGALNLTQELSVAGPFNTGNNLTLKSNATNTATVLPVTGSITGTVVAERYIPARRAFRFVTSSVNAGTILANWQEGGANVTGFGTDITGTGAATNGFDASISNNPSMFYYDNFNVGTGSSWVAMDNTNINTLSAGTAYRMLVRGDRTVDQTDNQATPTNTVLRATGTLVTGNVTRTDLNPMDDYFSLIGNPYHSQVNMQTVLSAANRLDPTFYYVWDPTVGTRGAYVTVNVVSNTNNFSGSLANRIADSGQSFFVRTVSGTGNPSLTFTEASKTTSAATQAIWRAAQDEVVSDLRMTLYSATALTSGSPAADGFYTVFSSDYSNDIDFMDARKPTNQDENAGMLVDGTLLSYQSRQMPVATDVIPLYHTQYRVSDYVYRAQLNNVAGVPAYLHDKFTETYHELANDATTDVPFSVDATDALSVAADRFEIVFQQQLGTDEFGTNAFSVYPNPVKGGEFHVNVPQQGTYDVSLYNTVGQRIVTQVNNEGTGLVVKAASTLATGVYTVTISNGTTSVTRKIIVN